MLGRSPAGSQDGARGRILATAAYFASVGLIGLISGSIGPTLAPLAAQTGVGLSTIGVALSARSFGYLFGAVASGRLMDRGNGHRGIGVALLFAGIALALIPIARSLASLLPIMMGLGCLLAALDVGANTLLLRSYGGRSAPYLNALHFSYGLGGLAAPFLVAAVSTPAAPLSWTYWILAVVPVPIALVLFRVPSPSSPERPLVDAVKRPSTRLSPLTAAVAFLYGGAEVGFASWLYVFLEGHAGTVAATNISGGYWATFSLFRLIGVFIARRGAPRRILFTDFAASLLFILPLLLLPDRGWALWVGAAGVSAAFASIYPTMIVMFSRGKELTGRQMAAILIASGLGSMTFPWLIGRLLAVVGPIAVPGVTAALLGGAFAATWGFLRKQARVSET